MEFSRKKKIRFRIRDKTKKKIKDHECIQEEEIKETGSSKDVQRKLTKVPIMKLKGRKNNKSYIKMIFPVYIPLHRSY